MADPTSLSYMPFRVISRNHFLYIIHNHFDLKLVSGVDHENFGHDKLARLRVIVTDLDSAHFL